MTRYKADGEELVTVETRDSGRLWVYLLFAMVAAAWLVGCGGDHSPTGPSEAPIAQEAAIAPLAVPARLRAVWAPAGRAGGAVGRLGANAVILQIDSWGEDLTSYAAWSRERGVGAIPYVGQCFEGSLPYRDTCWGYVERWVAPLKAAGVLWGFQGIDEPALHGKTTQAAEGVAYMRARGYDVLGVEWIEYVSDQRKYRLPRPAGLRWYGVTCYAYGGRTPWHVQGCAEEYARHPDWDTVVIPEGHYNQAEGYPYDRARWEAIAGSSRSIVFWSSESE